MTATSFSMATTVPLTDTAFLERSPGEGFLKQGGELVAARMAYARLRLGHLGSYSASHHHTLLLPPWLCRRPFIRFGSARQGLRKLAEGGP